MAIIEFMYTEGTYHHREFHNDSAQEETLKDISRRCNNTDLYRSVFTYKDESLEEMYGPLFFDLDTHNLEKDFEIIRRETLFVASWLENNFNTGAVTIYFSGAKGFHVMFDIGLGFEPAEELVSAYKTMALTMKDTWRHKDFIDTAIYDKRRVIRIENTINGKTGLYKIPITKDELRNVNYESLMIMAEHPRDLQECPFQIAGNKAREGWYFLMQPADPKYDIKQQTKIEKPDVQFSSGKILPCISAILSSSIEQGHRNIITHILSNSLFQNGYSYDDVVSTVTEWNESNSPPLDSRELITTINSARAMLRRECRYGCSKIKTLDLCLHCGLDGRKR